MTIPKATPVQRCTRVEEKESILTDRDTTRLQGHVNNVNYFRYAESARVNWITNFAVHADPAHRRQWSELMTPNSTGLIMRTLKSEFKLVSTIRGASMLLDNGTHALTSWSLPDSP